MEQRLRGGRFGCHGVLGVVQGGGFRVWGLGVRIVLGAGTVHVLGCRSWGETGGGVERGGGGAYLLAGGCTLFVARRVSAAKRVL